jgi:hypothetical protein
VAAETVAAEAARANSTTRSHFDPLARRKPLPSGGG